MFTGYKGKIYAACCADMAEANRYIDYLNNLAGEKVFGFCLDVGHALLVGKEIYSTIQEISRNLVALHVHDNDGRNDQHLFPYMGVMDWDRVRQGAEGRGLQGCAELRNLQRHSRHRRRTGAGRAEVPGQRRPAVCETHRGIRAKKFRPGSDSPDGFFI